MIFRTFSALVKLITVTRGDALRACPLAFILRAFGAAPLKNHDLAWIGSVPPAVAGGYVVDTLSSKKLRMHPPATAGGTDCIQLTFVSILQQSDDDDFIRQATERVLIVA